MNAVDAALHRQDPCTDTRSGDSQTDLRHDWTRAEIRALFELPFPELIFRAQSVHRLRFDPQITAEFITGLIGVMKTGPEQFDPHLLPEGGKTFPMNDMEDAGVLAS